MVYDLSKSAAQQEPEYIELYPSEMSEVKVLSARIQKKYGFQTMTEVLREQFVREVTDEFGKLGLRVRVTWELDVSGGPDDNLFHVPSISLVGRTEKQVTDHERIAFEVQSGEADGKKGTINDKGELKEDSKRTLY